MTYYSALHYAAKAEAAATTATTLLPYLTDITTVATNIASVNTVSTNISDVTTAATNISSINTVATNISDVNSVASNATNINTVATNISDVNSVATDISNVNSVAGDLTNIDAVAGDLTNIDAVAADLTNIDNASTYAAEAKQWAIGDPTEPVDGSAKYWAQQAAGQVIPSQTGHSGEYLTTDGSVLSWNNVDALPSQTGQSGKYLTTDGTDASWATISIPSVDIDGKSITRNASDELQTIGVINQNDTTTALKVWSGDEADLPVSKDSNTFYATEETVSVSLLEALYPVGSVYITTNATCPLSTLIAGSTWVAVGSGRVLQGADSDHNAGTTIEAGLPNITGTIGGCCDTGHTSGAFQISSDCGNFNGGPYIQEDITFDASRSSSIYGNSTTVQPPAYVVNIFERTA